MIEGKQIGIVGLDEVLEEFFRNGRRPEKSLKNDLLKRLQKLNYIPAGKQEAYASVFLDEYGKLFRGGVIAGEKKVSQSTKTWQGIPREEIPWFPTIREELCDGCGICLEFCSFEVFEYDEKINRVIIIHPFNCIVGCSMCAPKCKQKAIAFPPRAILETFRKR